MLMRPARAGPVAATVVRGAHPLLCTSPWSRHHSVRWAAVRGGRKRSATPAAASLGAGSSGSDASSTLGVVIVDHGSRREASNDLLVSSPPTRSRGTPYAQGRLLVMLACWEHTL
jgi:hypothetical protein